MSTDLYILTLIALLTGLTAMVAYWRGWNAGRREGRDETERLYDELDAAAATFEQIARQRHPSNRLRVVREES